VTRGIRATLGIDFPLLAFSHCRDVVAAVTNAGGFGVLGGSNFTPAELDRELTWIDGQVDGRPYGVDIVCPEPMAGAAAAFDPATLAAQVPREHREFVNRLLREHRVDAELTDDDLLHPIRVDPEIGRELLEVSFAHPIRLVANALGVPPAYMIEQARARGVPTAALVGAREHAVKQVAAGVDIIVAQGTEAGGHTGEVSTLVLVPEVIRAVGPDVPVLAAGGIVNGAQMAAAVALGAAGVWTGSVWLTTREAETAPATVRKMLAATSRDTVRSRGRTGKPSRQLRSAWTAAWAAPDSPAPLPMPLQSLISEPVLRRVDTLAEGGDPHAAELATYFVGQGVGLLDQVRPAREVVHAMAEEFLTATGRLTAFVSDLSAD
jgi:NAD(P)H-dependent flavin oxidoreductase YrpB (nitropropane dioxygenase family)